MKLSFCAYGWWQCIDYGTDTPLTLSILFCIYYLAYLVSISFQRFAFFIFDPVCVFLILAIFAATTNTLKIRHNLNGKIWISIRCKCGVFFKGLRISFSSMIFFPKSVYIRAYLKFIQYKMLLMPYTIPICIFFQVLFLNLCLRCNVSHMFRFPTLFLLAQRKKKKPIWFVCYCCCYR